MWSSGDQAAPRPSTARPPLTTSSVPTIFASIEGWRYVTPETRQPRRRLRVRAARVARSVQGSRNGNLLGHAGDPVQVVGGVEAVEAELLGQLALLRPATRDRRSPSFPRG